MSDCPSVGLFHMSRSNLRIPWPIHFKFHRVIGIDGLTVCILFGEISIFHSRAMGKKVFTNIVWMLTTGVSCALGAVVYCWKVWWTDMEWLWHRLPRICSLCHHNPPFPMLWFIHQYDFSQATFWQLGKDHQMNIHVTKKKLYT